jgi:hypothetical protein
LAKKPFVNCFSSEPESVDELPVFALLMT